mmetsp:Transcript_16117/g.37563  ORF Transcript_16117/g.37563 Transcript_16117/m.37563 type:complete len:107 (+) Transcript_16117:784-1104(+)
MSRHETHLSVFLLLFFLFFLPPLLSSRTLLQWTLPHLFPCRPSTTLDLVACVIGVPSQRRSPTTSIYQMNLQPMNPEPHCGVPFTQRVRAYVKPPSFPAFLPHVYF